MLRPAETVSAALPVRGPLRGIGFTPAPAGDVPTGPVSVRVRLFDTAHHLVAENDRTDPQPETGAAWIVPLAAENVPPSARLTAQITVTGNESVTVASHDGRPAMTTVAAVNDGLRLVYAQETTIYERTRALDRAHWAHSDPCRARRGPAGRLIASVSSSPDQVVLDAPGPTPSGRPATVSWVDDGLNQVVLDVDAHGTGYLVLDDAIQAGWRVSVDGSDATLVAGRPCVRGGSRTVGPSRGPLLLPAAVVGVGSLGQWSDHRVPARLARGPAVVAAARRPGRHGRVTGRTCPTAGEQRAAKRRETASMSPWRWVVPLGDAPGYGIGSHPDFRHGGRRV